MPAAVGGPPEKAPLYFAYTVVVVATEKRIADMVIEEFELEVGPTLSNRPFPVALGALFPEVVLIPMATVVQVEPAAAPMD